VKIIQIVLKIAVASCELNMASSEQNKQVVRQVFEFYNQQDKEKAEKLVSLKHLFLSRNTTNGLEFTLTIHRWTF